MLTLTLTLNASLLCMVKQPNLKLEPVACVYFKVIGAWWISAHPWEVRDRVCLARQVSVRFAGNLALISCTRPRTHPSLARVPEGLIRSYGRRKRWLPNAYNEVLHANVRSRCSLLSRNGLSPTRERGRCVTRQNNGFEGDYSVR